ncbi:hypothetical protein L211DRAFT_848723 [Terfezia boudieri ATCC MYA-4762]|uniref:Uncharacterized protein n=1 Tax=Terfezia boudieri ATCC MYA-4762 TaxID=1051890 RepID=A0A3N4LNL4_9PEZI|nr:hypothetical protein L211DRAFT_848723 [Terfezia boudieri ATCC MYA-4762]
MSTKIFILKLQSPKLPAPPNDYILVLNEHLTPDEFVADLQELFPAISTANGKLRLVLDGSYRMTPRQFLRYMMTTVAYTPEMKGGVCVPKLLGRGNGIQIVYGEGVQSTASRQSTIPASVGNMGKPVKQVGAMQISENLEPSASSRATQAHPETPCPGPAHENAKHVLVLIFQQEMSISPEVYFPIIALENVPQSGDYEECLWLESEILAKLPKWLDHSQVKLGFSYFGFQGGVGSRITWNKDSFSWSEGNKEWILNVAAYISW